MREKPSHMGAQESTASSMGRLPRRSIGAFSSWSKGDRRSLFYLLTALGLCGIWLLFSRWIIPGLIRGAYYGESWPIFNRIIAGQATHPLSQYLAAWDQIQWHVTILFLVAGALAALFVQPGFQQAIRALPVDTSLEAKSLPAALPGIVPSGKYSRHTLWLFGMIFATATVLRMIFLGGKSFFEDEMASRSFALAPWGALWSNLSSREANMTLYYGFLHFWVRLGKGAVVLRSPSVVFSLATLVLIYFLGRELFDSKTGLLGAFLFAISGFDIQYSQDARSYSLLLLLVTLSSLYFVRCIRRGSRSDWVGYVISSSLAVYAHLFAVLVLLSQWMLLLGWLRRRIPWRKWITAGVVIGVLDLPMILFVFFRDRGQLGWVPQTRLYAVFALFGHLAGYADPLHPFRYGPFLLVILYFSMLAAAIMAVFGASSGSTHAEGRLRLTFLFIWLMVPIVLTVSFSLFTPMLVARYLIICLPPFLLIPAYCLSRIRRNWILAALLAAIAGLSTQGLVSYYRSPGIEDWRGVDRYVLESAKPGDELLIYPGYLTHDFTYYQKRCEGNRRLSDPVILDRPPNRFSLALGSAVESLHRCKRIWLVSRVSSNVAEGKKESSVERRLAGAFPRDKSRQFSGVTVILYSR